MRNTTVAVLFAVLLGGCASTYDCGLFFRRPGTWRNVTPDAVVENELLVLASQQRQDPQWSLNPLHPDFSWYRDDYGNYALCIPPVEHSLRDELGCFSELYLFGEENGEMFLAEDLSIVCTS